MGNGRGHPVASSFDRKAGIEECATPSAVNFCVLSNTGNSSVPLGTSSTDPLCVPCCATYSPIPSPRDRYYHSVDLNVYTCARIKVKVYVCVSKNKRVFERVERSNAMAWRRKGKGRGSDGEGRKVGYIDNRFSRNRVDRPDTALLFYQSIYVYIYILFNRLIYHNPYFTRLFLSFPRYHIATNRESTFIRVSFNRVNFTPAFFFSSFLPLLSRSLRSCSLPPPSPPLRVKNLFANFSSLELVLKGCTFLTPFISGKKEQKYT